MLLSKTICFVTISKTLNHCFNVVFYKFVGVFDSQQHPLVLYLSKNEEEFISKNMLNTMTIGTTLLCSTNLQVSLTEKPIFSKKKKETSFIS